MSTKSHSYRAADRNSNRGDSGGMGYLENDPVGHYRSMKGEEFMIRTSTLERICKKIRGADEDGNATYEYGGHLIFNRGTHICVKDTFEKGTPNSFDIYAQYKLDVMKNSPKKYFLLPYHVHPRLLKLANYRSGLRMSEFERYYGDETANLIMNEFYSAVDIENYDKWGMSQGIVFMDDDNVTIITLDKNRHDTREFVDFTKGKMADSARRIISRMIRSGRKQLNAEDLSIIENAGLEYTKFLGNHGVSLKGYKVHNYVKRPLHPSEVNGILLKM